MDVQSTVDPGASPLNTNFPTTIEQPRSASLCEVTLMNRVGRVLQDLGAGRIVSDADLLQHRNDCRHLMEASHERWLDGRESRETVERWQACFMEAMRRLSPEFKAAREAQILAAAVAGPGGTGCYFMDQADAARARTAGRLG